MDLGLSDKVAVVCAASSGLGKATAVALAQEGAKVVICSRSEEKINAAAEEIMGLLPGTSILPVTADLSRRDDIAKLFRAAREAHDRVDILVTNTGGPPPGSFTDLTDENWQTGFDRNLLSAIRCIREAIPQMQENKWGRVINITSLTVKQPVNDLIVSSVLRPGIIGLAKVLANLYGKDGVTINSVAPGFIMTGRQQELGQARAGKQGISFEEYVREATVDIPAGRFGTPQELGSVITFLASRKASYINGVTLSVDGGLVKGIL